ncbi:hypothetical protein D3C76_679620 [compost metagenome]
MIEARANLTFIKNIIIVTQIKLNNSGIKLVTLFVNKSPRALTSPITLAKILPTGLESKN